MAKLSEKALLARDAKRDIGAELLESVRQMKREDLQYLPETVHDLKGDL